MMPIIINVYTVGFTSQLSAAMRVAGDETEFVIPTASIINSLVLVLVPVILGMILRKKSPGWAKTAEDTAGFLAVIVILYLIVMAFARHGGLFIKTPKEIYIASIGLGMAGFFFGYWFSRLIGMKPIFQRAIALETGIQNTPVAFAIILLSFNEPVQSQMLWLAILYATFIVMTSSGITLYFRKNGKFDWDVYKNTQIHNRLFGNDYVTYYPDGFLPARLVNDPSQGTQPAQKRR